MTFTFTNTIPAAGNNPSSDQPLMLVNNASTASIIDVDHVGFNQARGGFHRQVRMLDETIPATVANSGTLFCKAGTESNLIYVPDATTDEYQLTRTITASKALFATNTNYAPAVLNRNGGWTFLPGGMLLQYGIADVAAAGSETTIAFPIAFTGTPYSITVGNITSELSPSANNQFIREGTVSNVQFKVVNSSSSAARKIYWQAIGV